MIIVALTGPKCMKYHCTFLLDLFTNAIIFFSSLSCALPLFITCRCILLIEASVCVSSLFFAASFACQSVSFYPYCSNSQVHLNGDSSSKPLFVLCQWMSTCVFSSCVVL